MTTDIEKKLASEGTQQHKHHEGCAHDHEHGHDNERDSDSESGEIEDDKVLNRNEKKARKLLSKMGLKPVLGIERVTIKRSRMIFAIANPTVYKTSADTYVVFGEAKVEDAGLQAQAMAAQRLAAAAAQRQGQEETIVEAGKESMVTEEEEDIDTTGIDEKDIRIVMEQANVSRSKAAKALKANHNDIVNTIMELTV